MPAVTTGTKLRGFHSNSSGDDRNEREVVNVRRAEPALGDTRVHERRPDAHHRDEREHAVQRDRRVPPRPLPDVAFRLHDEPRRAEQRIAEQQADARGERERPQPVEARPREHAAGHGESFDVHAEHDTLEERRDRRSAEERQVPPAPMAGLLQPELEGDAAEDQAQQQQEQRKVDGGNDDRERERKRREQPHAAQDQPRLVAVPDRCDRIHHQRARVVVRCQRRENADAEIEAVEQHVHEDADAENQRPHGDEVEMHRVSRQVSASAPDSGRAGRSRSVGSRISTCAGGPARASRAM